MTELAEDEVEVAINFDFRGGLMWAFAAGVIVLTHELGREKAADLAEKIALCTMTEIEDALGGEL